MAQFLGSVLGGIAGTLLRTFNDSSPPDSVLEVKAEEYAQQPVCDREECLILYGPFRETYDIVLQIPFHNSARNVFRLYRSQSFLETRERFVILKDRIPILLECQEELCTRDKLQNICNLIQRQPTWTLAHLAACMGITECLNHVVIQSLINVPCKETGQTALHVAVAQENLKIVQVLLDLGARMDARDADGNTVHHLAAKLNKEMIQVLVSKSATLINCRNKEGHTALHLACLADKPECVKALIYAGADVNAMATVACDVETPTSGSVKDVMEMYRRQIHSKDMKHGGTPLHWAMSIEVVEALVELGCVVDARDFKGGTALHTMVIRSRLQCLIALLGYGADVNAVNENLDTPLHLAARKGTKSMIQSLLIFGANVNMTNKLGDTPRHIVASLRTGQTGDLLYILHSVGARRCEFDKLGCMDGCKYDGRNDGTLPEVFQSSRISQRFDEILGAAATISAMGNKKDLHNCADELKSSGYRVLCLDGGGVRGLVLIQLLVAIEDLMRRPLVECFDWIAGTSTGGILGLLIATGKSAKYCQSVYFRLKNKVFIGSTRPYDSDILEKFLQKELGEHTKMADVRHPKIAITGVLADRYPAALHFFRNYSSPEMLLGIKSETRFQPPPLPEDQLMWRAGRASGAAPTYFKALGRFIDGGLISNNPTMDIMTEIHEYNCALKTMGQGHKVRSMKCLVSLGSGKPPVVAVNAIDMFCPQNLWDVAKMAFGMSAFGKLLIDQATACEGRVVDRARAWCSTIGVPYFRFNPDLSEDVALDETKDEVLVNMLWETMVYIRNKKNDLSLLYNLLSG